MFKVETSLGRSLFQIEGGQVHLLFLWNSNEATVTEAGRI